MKPTFSCTFSEKESVRVGGENILPHPVPFEVSLDQTTKQIAGCINHGANRYFAKAKLGGFLIIKHRRWYHSLWIWFWRYFIERATRNPL